MSKIKKFNQFIRESFSNNRTPEEIKLALLTLENDLKNSPATSIFGDDNHKSIRIGIQIIKGEITEDDIYDMEDNGEIEYMDVSSYIDWLDGGVELKDIVFSDESIVTELPTTKNKVNLCPKICGECPFSNRSMKGFLADYEIEDFYKFMSSEVAFPCHMRMGEEDVDAQEAEGKISNGEMTICRGYVESLIKSGKSPKHSEILKKAIKQVKEDGLSDKTMSIFDFQKHHTIK